MRMQEPEQWPLSETDGTTDQEDGASRAETWPNAQEQKIYPQETLESRVSVLLMYLSMISGITLTFGEQCLLAGFNRYLLIYS